MGGAELRALVPTNMVSVWIPGAVEFQGWPQIIVPHFPVVVEQASVRSLQSMAEVDDMLCMQSQF